MTDAAAADRPARDAAAAAARLRRRRRLDARLRAAGIASLLFAAGMLAILVGSLISTGAPAFTQTHVTLEFDVSAKRVKPEDPARGAYRAIVADAIGALFPEVTDRREKRELVKIVSNGAQYMLRDAVVADPSLIGSRVRMAVPVSDPYDQLAKGLVRRDDPEDRRRLSDAEIARFDKLVELGLISRPFNKALFLNADSRFPELAGLNGALWGSFYALLVCFLVSFPAGIAAGVYLEEFAPRNRLTDLIEVNINNLAAVPSIIFGLLGLAVFLGFFGLPRSAPLVGGLVMALMTLPVIIIASRVALKAVPPSIREAALGVGASPLQTVTHHVLPLALPGILTGTIIGMARALGETAPLLMIGMVAFIVDIPGGLTDSATAIPVQIYMWADSPERAFTERTSAAILILLAFLILMNGLAVFLRKKFERRW